MTELALQVNGKDVRVDVEDNDTLLHVLRNRLGLKGARFGCGLEQCGSCSVLIDGALVYACTYRAEDAAARSVQTVEGLASDGELHPIQQAFLEEQAGQCGYCLSGLVLSAKALLDAIPDPTREQIVEALDGNICRCGAQLRMVRAVQRAARLLQGGAAR